MTGSPTKPVQKRQNGHDMTYRRQRGPGQLGQESNDRTVDGQAVTATENMTAEQETNERKMKHDP